MAGFRLGKPWDATAKTLAGLGALNWGLVEFASVNLVDFVPDAFSKVIVGAIGLSGIYVLQLVYNKNI